MLSFKFVIEEVFNDLLVYETEPANERHGVWRKIRGYSRNRVIYHSTYRV